MFRLHPIAEDELNQAADYYDDQQAGLGVEFVDEVYLTIQRIIEFPKAWTSLSKRSRRCMTNRFPYQVIYEIREESILILAIGHLHRKPGYWEDR